MTLVIISCYIAGVSHARPDYAAIKSGDIVDLVPEPNNQFDKFAVRVHHRDCGKLGYIPAETTFSYHTAVQNGLQPVATIAQVLPENKAHKSILLVVTVTI